MNNCLAYSIASPPIVKRPLVKWRMEMGVRLTFLGPIDFTERKGRREAWRVGEGGSLALILHCRGRGCFELRTQATRGE